MLDGGFRSLGGAPRLPRARRGPHAARALVESDFLQHVPSRRTPSVPRGPDGAPGRTGAKTGCECAGNPRAAGDSGESKTEHRDPVNGPAFDQMDAHGPVAVWHATAPAS